jgi:hypothetical protein
MVDMLVIPAHGRLRQKDWQVQGQPWLYSKTLSQKAIKKAHDFL